MDERMHARMDGWVGLMGGWDGWHGWKEGWMDVSIHVHVIVNTCQ